MKRPILVGWGIVDGKTPLVPRAPRIKIISCCGVHWLVLSISIILMEC